MLVFALSADALPARRRAVPKQAERSPEWERSAEARLARALTPADLARETSDFWRLYNMSEFLTWPFRGADAQSATGTAAGAHARLDEAGSVTHGDCQLARLNAPTAAQFAALHGARGIPAVIAGVASHWPAMERWTWPALLAARGEWAVQLARSETGAAPAVTVSAFAAYMERNNDMSPRYVFDSELLSTRPELREEFALPPYLAGNMFDRLPAHLRPALEWVLLGPRRSGTAWHTDPYNTSAWNALISGTKLWLLYPKTTYAPPGVYASELAGAAVKYCTAGGECRGQAAIEWFRKTLPYLDGASRPLRCVQRAGEIMFVPEGWWHTVLNIDDTVAVTANFIDAHNVHEMLASMLEAARANREYATVAATFVRRWRDDPPPGVVFTRAQLELADALGEAP